MGDDNVVDRLFKLNFKKESAKQKVAGEDVAQLISR